MGDEYKKVGNAMLSILARIWITTEANIFITFYSGEGGHWHMLSLRKFPLEELSRAHVSRPCKCCL